MGNVKSFRMSDKTDLMFEALKNYYGDKKNDSTIISLGIERLFKDVSDEQNTMYRNRMYSNLKDEQIKLFDQMCDVLDVLAFSSGHFLEEEIKYFVCYTQRFDISYHFLTPDETSKMNVFQYDKIEAILVRAGYNEKNLKEFAACLKNYYKN